MKAVLITVIRNPATYRQCIADNPFCSKMEQVAIDNRGENKPVPAQYNKFIDSLGDGDDSWLIFCHEDFEFQENISLLLEGLDREALHGVIGSARCGLAGFGRQVIYGNMTECKREDGDDSWSPGRTIGKAVKVETFDCCCLIVHSSLVKKHGLRFDEQLSFDLYVEDFCAMAKVLHGIRSFVHPVKCCHHSGSRATERLMRHLPYLAEKYPHNCFVGSCAYFGTPSWQKVLQDHLMYLVRRPTVSIVLLTWNRAAMLDICLREMFSSLSNEVSREIILMDNCSDDATPEVLLKYSSFPGVRVVRNKTNLRLNAYKRLFRMARGRVIIEVDDDILRFPKGFDKIFLDYMAAYRDYGYLALNVEQNSKTNGAKPDESCYHDDIRGDKVVQEGPTGGWCAAFRRWHYIVALPWLCFVDLSMKRVEDGVLMGITKKIFRKRHGIIKNAVCLHASGPAYAREFGLLKIAREKYLAAGLSDMAEKYQ